MKIKDRPEYNAKLRPVTFPKTASVRDAIATMSEKNYGSVVVVDKDDKVEGIVTERDLMIRVLHKKVNPDKTTLADIMTSNVRTANENDEVIDWLRIMSNERFRHLPVVDDNGCIKNLMSQGDFVSYTWPSLITQVTAKTKESIFGGYQIALIITAVLIYSLLLNIFG